MEKEILKVDYENQKPKAIRFKSAISEQLQDLIDKQSITLGTPMEGRIKTLSSINEKIERKKKVIHSVTDLDDFVGIRIIVLFRSDIEKVCEIVKNHFEIVDIEDVSTRLSDDQFGYQSNHYTIKLPNSWLSLPTLSDLEQFKAEIQIRTLSQHIWAVASHKLQYKQEQSVPVPLRRSINRASALLETVDLEFERVLLERENYKVDSLANVDDNSGFDVMVLEAIADKMLPAQNKKVGYEDYSRLLDQLFEYGFDHASKLEALITSNLDYALAEDRDRVHKELSTYDEDTDLDRLNRGVFYTHVGLIRNCLENALGEAYVAPVAAENED
ncbi:GTP pyrophosphokinase [Vibrio aestuarianus]|uniref:GTP pyrophosphokinase n=1 Tax=Vibrio aestuarianus TaxID=28171 RepID=UPI00237CD4F7|nr:RelA/SpoT domain-containing protein [Vibrio aestuarianus]MDE1233359.1 RelA/SpoT domain-containing protein [Vibrio aestuarianus]